MKSLFQIFSSLILQKDSVLCIGLDPALPQQRNNNTIPSKYIDRYNENDSRLNFCLDIINEVSDYCIAAKPNHQYIFGFSKKEHQVLTASIREHGMLSILDYKLNDIKDSVESSIFHILDCGYDAVTFNPLMGNMRETVGFAHSMGEKRRGQELGIIVLTLTSNPEALKYMKNANCPDSPMYLNIANEIKLTEADGAVVGATGHITETDISKIRNTIGDDKLLLIPGVGTQKGDFEKIIKCGGKNITINVGRDIIYSANPKEIAKKYNESFNIIRRIQK